MKRESGSGWKLGMFVIIGLVLFIGTIYFVGKQKNLFGSTFHLKTQFKTVSGLEVGNNVRFSGINIGTISEIELMTDTSVLVEMGIRKSVQQFIKKDALAGIGSDGLMGDKVLTISPGSASKITVEDNDRIVSKSPVEMADIMGSLKASVDNAGIITAQLAQLTLKLNNGNGTLSRLISDEGLSGSLKSTLTNLQTSSNEFAKFTTNLNEGALGTKLDSTMSNLQAGSKGLSDNMEAVKHNFLLRGYYKKQKKAEAKKQADLKKAADLKKKNDLKNGIAPVKVDSLNKPVLNEKDSIKQ
jgi:phospholipid/cholesterol/gamma-HCH transport system substrate-binding protein